MSNQYIQQLSREIKLRGFTEKTQQVYIDNVKLFMRHFKGIRPSHITIDHIQNYKLYLINKNQSHRYINQQMSSIKFFCKNVLKKSWDFSEICMLKEYKKLPVVMEQEDIKTIIEGLDNLKHKAMISTLYATGMRVNELLHLQYNDIDSKSMTIRVRKGKGRRERDVILSSKLLELLRDYWKNYPQDKSKYLFPGVKSNKMSRPDYVSSVIRRTKKKLNLKIKGSAHSMRHSYASHSLEKGVDLRVIQKLMGHKSILSTCVYLHVAKKTISKTPSPFDDL